MPDTAPWRRDALPAGTVLRDYRLESVIGSGGFGIVYRARHVALGLTVAVKEYVPIELAVREGSAVRPRSSTDNRHFDDGLRRFRDEARALIAFRSHSSIVSFRDFFLANGTAYLVMEHEEGVSLAEFLAGREKEGRPFGQSELLAVMVPLLEGLASVHEAGILHRDIKPSNILIRLSDEQPVLIDFGAAKQIVARRTKSIAPFTEGYAALEQVADAGELGPWTDIYGVGAVMWRIVAGGQRPWEPPNPLSVERRSHAALGGQQDPLPSAGELGDGRFAPGLLAAIDRCLRLQEAERVPNCGSLLRSLREYGGNRTAGSVPVATAQPASGSGKRSTWKLRVLALSASLLLAIVFSQWWSAIPSRDRAVLISNVEETTSPLFDEKLEITDPADRVRSTDPENVSQGTSLPSLEKSATTLGQAELTDATGASVDGSGSSGNENEHGQRAELAEEVGAETRPPRTVDGNGSYPPAVVVGTDRSEPNDEIRTPNSERSRKRGSGSIELIEQGNDTQISQDRSNEVASRRHDATVPDSEVARSATDRAIDSGDSMGRSVADPNQKKQGEQAQSSQGLEPRAPIDRRKRRESGLAEQRIGSTSESNSAIQRLSSPIGLDRAGSDRYWTVGSHADEVLRLQGTPTDVDRYPSLGKEIWWYGTSNVEINVRTRRVVEWDNGRGNLKVTMRPSRGPE